MGNDNPDLEKSVDDAVIGSGRNVGNAGRGAIELSAFSRQLGELRDSIGRVDGRTTKLEKELVTRKLLWWFAFLAPFLFSLWVAFHHWNTLPGMKEAVRLAIQDALQLSPSPPLSGPATLAKPHTAAVGGGGKAQVSEAVQSAFSPSSQPSTNKLAAAGQAGAAATDGSGGGKAPLPTDASRPDQATFPCSGPPASCPGGIQGGSQTPDASALIDKAVNVANKLVADKEKDILSSFGPTAVTIALVLLGWVGLKRLEMYDAEMNRIREEMNHRMGALQDFVGTEVRETRKEMGERLKSFTETTEKTLSTTAGDFLAKNTEKSLSEVRKNLESAKRDAKGAGDYVDSKISELDKKLERFGWIERLGGDVQEQLAGEATPSAGSAHDTVARLFDEGKFAQAVAVTERVLASAEVTGSPDDWFNLSAELGRRDLEKLALRACERGLEAHGSNVDLLAHATVFAGKVGEIAKAEGFVKRLEALGRQNWNWRGFVFVGDYLEAIGKIEESIKINEVFRKHIPSDERGYSQPAIILHKLGQHDKVVEIYEEGKKKLGSGGAQLGLAAAQAFNALGQSERAIEASDFALIGATESQPSASQAAVFYERARAYDALAIRSLERIRALDDRVDNDALALCVGLVQRALASYKTAVDIPAPKPARVYERQLQARAMVLETMLAEVGVGEDAITEIFGKVKQEQDQEQEKMRLFRTLLQQAAKEKQSESSDEEDA
ncbi:MAG: tetratricopeptide repeat protein [Magnetococcales bacterium]|nr:tetratricopeptide repeat protein [Magnetococcales bacterium]